MSNEICEIKSEKANNSKDGNLICETGIGFSQRDKNVKQEEDKGFLEFRVIKNDGTSENLKLLTDLKNIISKQLPKMPKEYIVRLVFDRKHESMVIIKSMIFLYNLSKQQIIL